MLEALSGLGWKVVGLERSLDSARLVKNVPVVVGGLESLVDSAQFDLIILHHVLEHLTGPREVIERCARLLKPGGIVIISVPNIASWQFAVTGRHWLALDVPRHLNHFTPRTLSRAVEQSGLRIVGLSHVSPDHDPFGWIQSLLNAARLPQNFLFRMLMRDADAGLLSGAGLISAAATVLLAVPSAVLSVASWLTGASANIELTAVRTRPS